MKERKKERKKCFTPKTLKKCFTPKTLKECFTPKTLKKCFTKTTRSFRVWQFGTSFASGFFF
jgi:hypothetical protein